ncbi:MAG: hypothetical protein WEC75_03790 [Dehalococcoidia bacterium]
MGIPNLDQVKQEAFDSDGEEAFWEAQYADLLPEHSDRFVAVHRGQVVATETTFDSLLEALTARRIDPRDTWMRFVRADRAKMLL